MRTRTSALLLSVLVVACGTSPTPDVSTNDRTTAPEQGISDVPVTDTTPSDGAIDVPPTDEAPPMDGSSDVALDANSNDALDVTIDVSADRVEETSTREASGPDAAPDIAMDSPAPPDVVVDVVTPDVPRPDVASNPEAGTPAGWRPWTGPTALVRFMNFTRQEPAVVHHLCLFGMDSDPRPYMILSDRSHPASERSYTVGARYVRVPAGINLRVFEGGASAEASNDPAQCDSMRQTPFNRNQVLLANRFYTTVQTRIEAASSLLCDRNAGEGCRYFPRADPLRPAATCATSGIYTLPDGDLFEGRYHPGIRWINATHNAAELLAQSAGDAPAGGRYALNIEFTDPALVLYTEPTTASRYFVCPAYIYNCQRGSFPMPADALTAYTACRSGDTRWLAGNVSDPRLALADRETSVYFLGTARKLTADYRALQGDDVQVVIAADISDGTLPLP